MKKEKLYMKKQCINLERVIKTELSKGKCISKIVYSQSIIFKKNIKEYLKDKYKGECEIDIKTESMIDYTGQKHIDIEMEIDYVEGVFRYSTSIF